jgi:hypothetical protein
VTTTARTGGEASDCSSGSTTTRRVAKGWFAAADPPAALTRTSPGEALPSRDVPRPSTDEISKRIENTVYTAVGLGILGFQHLQVQRQQLKRAIENAWKKPKR